MVGHADILKTGGSLLFCGNLSTISRDSQSHTSELDGGGGIADTTTIDVGVMLDPDIFGHLLSENHRITRVYLKK